MKPFQHIVTGLALAAVLTISVAVQLTTLAGFAHAAFITRTYDFTASGFGVGAPIDPLVGRVTVTFDPAVQVSNTSAGITLNSINIAVDPQLVFTYDPAFDRLGFGGTGNALTVTAGTNDFGFLIISGATTLSPTPSTVLLTQSGFASFATSNSTVTVVQVPEPGTLLLVSFGLAGFAFAHWRHSALSSRGAVA